MPSRKYLGLGLVVGLGVVLFVLLPSFATLYTDWLWFLEVGHEQVFMKTLNSRLLLGAAAFVMAFGVLYVNIRIAQRGLKQREFTVFGAQGARTIAIDMRSLRPLFYMGAAIAPSSSVMKTRP